MREDLLFAALPYAAFLSWGIGAALVLHRVSRRAAEARSEGLPRQPASWASWSLRLGLAGVAVAHLVGFLAPGALEALQGHPRLLLTVEASGALLGLLAFVGLILETVPRLVRPAPKRVVDTVALTLLAAGLGSGLGLALLYRGGLSWYGTLLVPYLKSLLVLEPRVGLLTPLPFLVRLHVLAALLLLAVAAWTSPVEHALRRVPRMLDAGRSRSAPAAHETT